MTDMQTETTDYPKPTFSHRAYGVQVEWFGEDGGMVALGHISDLRFVAACNCLARKEGGLRNIWDDPAVTLDDVLAEVKRIWAVPADPAGVSSDPDGWAVSWYGITEQTPGAIALTVLDP